MSKPVPEEKLREYAEMAMRGLMYFALMKSPDPEKAKLLARLGEIRLEVFEIMDKLVPNWGE